MTISIDGRGLACPGPVLKTKEAVDSQNPGHISVTVDNDAAAENVSRFLTHSSFEVSVDSDGRTSVIEGTRQGDHLFLTRSRNLKSRGFIFLSAAPA